MEFMTKDCLCSFYRLCDLRVILRAANDLSCCNTSRYFAVFNMTNQVEKYPV